MSQGAIVNPTRAIPRFRLNNVTPFTYRDGLTYLQLLERIREEFNSLVDNQNETVEAVNDFFDEATNSFEMLISQHANEYQDFIDTSSAEYEAFKVATTGLYDDFIDLMGQSWSDFQDNLQNVILQGLDVIAGLTGEDDAVAHLIGDKSSQTRGGVRSMIERARIAPSAAAITEYADPVRYVLAQVGATLYAKWTIGAIPRLDKSTDNGKTWTARGNFPAKVDYLMVAKSGTLIAVEGEATGGVYPTPPSPRVWRSTDDGVTWTLIPGVLNFPPLGAQGLAEGVDGSLMISEYGPFRPWVYRVRRSTDDGLTWATVLSSDGRDPGAGDNGHIHSLTGDPYQSGRYNVFMDYNVGPAGPEVWTSVDNGATWSFVGRSLTNDQPNFVTPMYFENYVAWGSDNNFNGRVSRLSRADFYSGNFAATEHVAQISEKAIYGAVQVRPGVCAFAVNGEHIASPQQDGLYSTTSEIYLLSDEGELVSGGLSSYFASVAPGPLTGVRVHFPYRQPDDVDTRGIFWANFPTGGGRPTYTAVPITQGWEPPSQKIVFTDTPRVRVGSPLLVQGAGGPSDAFGFVVHQDDGATVVSNSAVPVASRSALSFLPSGNIEFRAGTARAATLTGGSLRFERRVDLDSGTGAGLRYSPVRPDGVLDAAGGSLCITPITGEQLWVKTTATGTLTGWRRVAPFSVAGASLADATHTVNVNGKFAGAMVYDTTNQRPMWATGSGATQQWRDAAGGNAVTPV